MFFVTLRLADKSRAPALMEGHNAWIRRGFDAGMFLLVGSLAGQGGGAIVAHGVEKAELEAFLAQDPFVAEGVVAAELVEVSPGRVDERLAFLQS